MANVNFTQGLKMVGDRASGVAGAGAAITHMSLDDGAVTGGGHTNFVNTDTTLRNGGTGGPTLQSSSAVLDSTPTSPAAATPHVVTHVYTLPAADVNLNTKTITRIALHNGAPSATSSTLMFGIDGLSLTKQSTFSLVTTFKLSYT
jgi:hypothetical protein